MADPDWGAQIHQYYGRTPYWHDEKPVDFDKEYAGRRRYEGGVE
jgi:hypothetical protein